MLATIKPGMQSRYVGFICMGIGLYLLAFIAAQYEASKKKPTTYPRTILIVATVLAVVGYGYSIYRKHGGAPPASPSISSPQPEPEYRPVTSPVYSYSAPPMTEQYFPAQAAR